MRSTIGSPTLPAVLRALALLLGVVGAGGCFAPLEERPASAVCAEAGPIGTHVEALIDGSTSVRSWESLDRPLSDLAELAEHLSADSEHLTRINVSLIGGRSFGDANRVLTLDVPGAPAPVEPIGDNLYDLHRTKVHAEAARARVARLACRAEALEALRLALRELAGGFVADSATDLVGAWAAAARRARRVEADRFLVSWTDAVDSGRQVIPESMDLTGVTTIVRMSVGPAATPIDTAEREARWTRSLEAAGSPDVRFLPVGISWSSFASLRKGE